MTYEQHLYDIEEQKLQFDIFLNKIDTWTAASKCFLNELVVSGIPKRKIKKELILFETNIKGRKLSFVEKQAIKLLVAKACLLKNQPD